MSRWPNNFTERKVIMEGQLCLKSLNDICSMFSHEEHGVTDSNNCPFVQNRTSQKDNLKVFYIPSFQRGYRWTHLQVEQLVQDLVAFHKDSSKTVKEWYCLQPLVVVRGEGETNKGRCVVIDGQQRLTTLYLILKFLGVDEPYSIEYETREGTNGFLKEIDKVNDAKCQQNPDFFCIHKAWETIRKQLGSCSDKKCLSDTILSRAKVIWYETKGNPYDEFSRLNSGKISLSNAELIKALLLKESLHDGKRQLSQLEAAREWDYMEQMLQDDDFWCFINPSPNDKRFNATRLDFVFEMVLRMDGEKNKFIQAYAQTRKTKNGPQTEDGQNVKLLEELEKNPYFIFGVFQDYCATPDGAIAIWSAVQGVFRRIHSWYADRNLFHRVGYLMNRKGKTSEDKFCALANWLSQATTKTKPEFKAELDSAINVNDLLDKLDTFEYEKNNDELNNILLLFNIAIIMCQRQEESRYPFREHISAAWTLEHIHAKSERSLEASDFNRIASWLSVDLTQKQTDQDKVIALNERFRSFEGQRQWGIGSLQIDSVRTEGENVEWHFSDGKNLHTIGNLALLGHRANSSFNNSLFSEKREILVQWQEREVRNDNRDKGKVKRFTDSGFDKVEFVPMATIKAFFKQFSQEITLPFLWTEKDAENYVTAIRETLKSEFSSKNAHDSSGKGV